MYELKAINLDNGVIIVHPLREEDMERYDNLVNDLFEIYSDKDSTEFIPEKRVKEKKQISNRLTGIVSRYSRKVGYTHFITLKNTNKTIGIVDIITPTLTEHDYEIKDTWFIEYSLIKSFWGKGIMTGVVGAILKNMKNQGINNIAALCTHDNIRSIRVLEKLGFLCVKQFEGQCLYAYSKNT